MIGERDRFKSMILYRIDMGESLYSIAKDLGMTRERVRQIAYSSNDENSHD